MARIDEAVVFLIAVASITSAAFAAVKQTPAPPAPIPAQIVSAKKVFISYGGGEERWYEDPVFTGGSDRTYNEFYADIKTWDRYELVDNPADADLIFEIGLSAPAISGLASQGDTLERKPYDPQFRLVIRDPKTNTSLWAFTEHVQWAILQGNRDKNYEATLNKIAGDLQALVGGTAPTPASAH